MHDTDDGGCWSLQVGVGVYGSVISRLICLPNLAYLHFSPVALDNDLGPTARL